MIRHMLIGAAGVLALVGMAVADVAIEERIKPVGDVCMAGDPCAAAVTTVASSEGGGAARSGDAVYTSKCATCHATGAAGAPKMGDTGAWAARLEKGMDTLYTGAIDGIGAMPAKGLCFDCSDDEIKAAVDHMVASVK